MAPECGFTFALAAMQEAAPKRLQWTSQLPILRSDDALTRLLTCAVNAGTRELRVLILRMSSASVFTLPSHQYTDSTPVKRVKESGGMKCWPGKLRLQAYLLKQRSVPKARQQHLVKSTVSACQTSAWHSHAESHAENFCMPRRPPGMMFTQAASLFSTRLWAIVWPTSCGRQRKPQCGTCAQCHAEPKQQSQAAFIQ